MTNLSASESETLDQAAAALLAARRARTPLAAAPVGLSLTSEAEAYGVQRRTLAALGANGGWKVGAPGPEGAPNRAPMPLSGFHPSPATLAASEFSFVGAEGEIALRFARDLPPRAEPYSREEVVAAVGSVHAAIEIVDSRFQDRKAVGGFWPLADLQNHGAFVLGSGIEDWSALSLVDHPVVFTIDGEVRVDRTGGNPGGDPLRLVTWLANQLAATEGGLKAGEVVTTGAVTGLILVTAGQKVHVRFPGLGEAFLTLV